MDEPAVIMLVVSETVAKKWVAYRTTLQRLRLEAVVPVLPLLQHPFHLFSLLEPSFTI